MNKYGSSSFFSSTSFPTEPISALFHTTVKQHDHLIRPPNMGNLFQKLLNSFYSKNLEVVLVGLENSGKTTLVNVLAAGHPMETCPTIGLNVKVVKKGGVTMKCWDIGGQEQYRSEWGRYTRGCDVIIYVLDTFAVDKAATARRELHRLLEDRELATTPLLVLANKIDLEPHMSESDVIRELNLEYVTENPWLVLPISAVKQTNIDQVISWLVKHGK
tara:strand:+ start:63 stop:713 length:651 start_codon:yes stop_codon:yes gene_type:complete